MRLGFSAFQVAMATGCIFVMLLSNPDSESEDQIEIVFGFTLILFVTGMCVDHVHQFF